MLYISKLHSTATPFFIGFLLRKTFVEHFLPTPHHPSTMQGSKEQPRQNGDDQRRRMAIGNVLNTNSDDADRRPPSSSLNSRSRQNSHCSDSSGGSSQMNRLPSTPVSLPYVKLSHHARERREFRPTYQQEEEYFIWYHRVDLGMDWCDVRLAYNRQFPDRQRRGFQGIQCKYYRCCEFHGVPRVRERNRVASPEKSYGVRSRLPGIWYAWMRR